MYTTPAAREPAHDNECRSLP